MKAIDKPTLLLMARRNLRQLLAKASFSSTIDHWSAGQCLDRLEEALDAKATAEATLVADLKRCLNDVATEMRARGRDDSRFTQLASRLAALTGAGHE